MTNNNTRFILSYIALLVVSILLPQLNAASLSDGLATKLEIFPLNEKSKYIQVSQLEQILLSIEETYKTMNEKQKEDAISISQATTELQFINQRLQNIENQINRMEQAEIFNKHRFELFQDSYIKEGLQFDELKRKIEKNQQQTNNRISEIDSSLEKVSNTQETLLKEVRKSSVTQTKLMNSIEEINETLKPDWSKFQKSINIGQQRLLEEMQELFKNLTNLMTSTKDIRVMKQMPASLNNISTETHTNIYNDDGTNRDILGSSTNINDKMRSILEYMTSSMNKCISFGENFNDELQAQKLDLANLITDTQKFIVDEVTKKNIDHIDELSTIFKTNFGILFNEQEEFKNKCHAIQLHEERLEDKTVYVLEKLFTYISNKTDGIRSEIHRLLEEEIKPNSYLTNEIQRVKELIDNYKNCTEKEMTKKLVISSTPTPAETKTKKFKANYISSSTTPSWLTIDQSDEESDNFT